MKAEKMFENLGFQKTISKIGNNIYAIEYWKNYTGTVKFDLKNKCYQTSIYNFDLNLIKSINKQLKELGWLDD